MLLIVAAAALMGVGHEIQREQVILYDAEVSSSTSSISYVDAYWVLSRSITRGPSVGSEVLARLANNEEYTKRVAPVVTVESNRSEDWVRELVCSDEWTWDCGWALRTIFGGAVGCPNGESFGSATAVGSGWYMGQQWWFYGLWQIAVPVPPGNGYDWLFDPYLNTVEAHLKYLSGGKSHWPVCGRT